MNFPNRDTAQAGHRRESATLFAVMLTIAAGNTAVQSVMPLIGRRLGMPDVAVVGAFSVSALIWSLIASWWARQLDHRSSRSMIAIGLTGYILSQIMTGAVLVTALRGHLAPAVVFFGFIVARLIYAGLGAAAPPAAQAAIAARTSGQDRTNALSILASAFGLGTIVGPALAPFFTLPDIGAAGAPFVFAVLGLLVLLAAMRILERTDQRDHPRGASSAYPSIGGQPSGASVIAATAPAPPTGTAGRARWGDPRIKRWLIAGLVTGHAQSMTGMAIGFLVLDRVPLPANQAQQMIGIVLMIGAGASLLTQWALIPRLALQPREMIVWGSLIAAVGTLATGFAGSLHAIAVAFGLASLGFGFVRPGFAAGASLAVDANHQADVAGKVTAVNGAAFVLAPSAGMLLYGVARPLPFEVAAVALIVLMAVLMLLPPAADTSEEAGAVPG